MKHSPTLWFARRPGGGWRISVTGIFVLVLFGGLFVAAMTMFHGFTRVVLAPLVVSVFIALAVGKTGFRRSDVA